MAKGKRIRACKPYERRWHDRCVDRNLEDEWLARLNHLTVFNLINICEGHVEGKIGASRRAPHIRLNLKEDFLREAAGQWEELRLILGTELERLFSQGESYVDLELKHRFRWKRGRIFYLESLSVRVRALRQRETEILEPETRAWFEHTIKRLERLDTVIAVQLEQ